MKFNDVVNLYKNEILTDKSFTKDIIRIETHVESLKDWSELITLNDLKKLFKKKQKNCEMKIKKINLNRTRDWIIDNKTGNISHNSKNFFTILGVNIYGTKKREVGKSWDQPLLKEKNLVGGIVGIIRKKINNIPYYLIEFKSEPGNADKVQISPCLQATYSNIYKAHGGRAPFLANFFLNPKQNGFKVLFEQYMSEDGGRFYKKKNKGMLIECSHKKKISISNNFFWLSLFQLKYFIKNNSWVNPHTRSIISHL